MEKVNTLTGSEINAIFARWYNGEKVNSLLEDLNIEKIANQAFAKYFPPILCDLICPNCSEDLYAFRSNSAYYKKTNIAYDVSSAHCLQCVHKEFSSCSCLTCKSKKEEEKRLRAEKEAERASFREAYLDRLYDEIIPINFEEDDLVKLIYFYSLCYQSISEDVILISPPSAGESSLSPSTQWDREIIQNLLDHIAPFCENEKLLQIGEDGVLSWDGQKVFYKIKLNEVEETDFLEALLKCIKHKICQLNTEKKFEIASLFEKLMIEECVAYLEYMRNDFGFSHEVGPKTLALFKKLIQNWRIDQIYTIIWMQCKNALAYKVQNGLPSKHASNLVISFIDKYVDKVNLNNWQIKSYYRDTSKKQSSISYVLFNKILEFNGFGVEFNLQDILTKINSLSFSSEEQEAK